MAARTGAASLASVAQYAMTADTPSDLSFKPWSARVSGISECRPPGKCQNGCKALTPKLQPPRKSIYATRRDGLGAVCRTRDHEGFCASRSFS